ncbi:transposase, partial [Myroides profundi]
MGREPKNKERYHLKFIEQIVQEIENGASQNSVIREYSLNKSTLNRWVKKYASPEYHATRKNKVYSESLKRQVVHSITEHHMTAQEACIMYGVESISTINNWL